MVRKFCDLTRHEKDAISDTDILPSTNLDFYLGKPAIPTPDLESIAASNMADLPLTQVFKYRLRSPLREPAVSHAYTDPRYISFRHPGYPQRDDAPLLQLPALDQDGRGIHHGIAATACAIIAGNAFSGYISDSASPNQPVSLGYDELLVKSEYWFHVPHPGGDHDQNSDLSPEGSYQYPIVLNFDNWQFPHQLVSPVPNQQPNEFIHYIRSSWRFQTDTRDPPVFQRSLSAGSQVVRSRDSERCRITSRRDVNQVAHIIPAKENSWAGRNRMRRYLPVAQQAFQLEGSANKVLLSAQIHLSFDHPDFFIAPKGAAPLSSWPPEPQRRDSIADSSTFAVHYVNALHSELASEFHDRPFAVPSELPPAFLFARFALTILPMTDAFVSIGVMRKVILVDKSTNDVHVRKASGSDLKRLARRSSKSRSASPKKRSHSALDDISEVHRSRWYDEDQEERRWSRRDRFEADWAHKSSTHVTRDKSHQILTKLHTSTSAVPREPYATPSPSE